MITLNYIIFSNYYRLWSTNTPQIRRVPVSNTCHVWHQHDTDTYFSNCERCRRVSVRVRAT